MVIVTTRSTVSYEKKSQEKEIFDRDSSQIRGNGNR
jgi:hypothetical protein